MKPVALALVLSVALAPAAHAGPPWIRANLQGHPTAGGFIVLSTFHHGTQQPMPLHGTAEGLVDGRRSSVALRFDAVPDTSGVYTVPRTWGDGGVWVLNISTNEQHGGAGIVVGVDRGGRPAWQQTPRTHEGLSRPATAREVSALLAALDAGQPAPELRRAGLLGLLRRIILPLGLLGVLVGGSLWLLVRIGRHAVAAFRRSRAVAA